MPASWTAYIVSWVIWLRYKGLFQSAKAVHRHIEFDRRTKQTRPPAYLYRQCIIEQRHVGGCIVYDVAPKSELPNQAHILYLHGGAFVFEIDQAHWRIIATLAERLQAVVTVAIYPLGPEHSLLEMYDAVQPLYDEMALPSRDNTPFFVVGDSAGGTMALALTQRALRAETRIASRLVLISPGVEFTFTNPETKATAHMDPWLDIPGLKEVVRILCPDLAADDPRVSPIYGELEELPPMLVFAGTHDLLSPDTKRFVAKVKAKGREVELVEGDGMLHVWPLVPIPEAEEAVDKLVLWLNRAKPRRQERKYTITFPGGRIEG